MNVLYTLLSKFRIAYNTMLIQSNPYPWVERGQWNDKKNLYEGVTFDSRKNYGL